MLGSTDLAHTPSPVAYRCINIVNHYEGVYALCLFLYGLMRVHKPKNRISQIFLRLLQYVGCAEVFLKPS